MAFWLLWVGLMVSAATGGHWQWWAVALAVNVSFSFGVFHAQRMAQLEGENE